MLMDTTHKESLGVAAIFSVCCFTIGISFYLGGFTILEEANLSVSRALMHLFSISAEYILGKISWLFTGMVDKFFVSSCPFVEEEKNNRVWSGDAGKYYVSEFYKVDIHRAS